jgi:hypothetical protein
MPRVVGALAGLLALPAAIWAFFHFFQLLTDGYVAWRAPHYTPAVFQLEWTYLDEGSALAVGTIAGRRERLSLRGLTPRAATSFNDLEDLMQGVERIDVLYDPEATHTAFAGDRLRVLPYTADLRGKRLGRLRRTLLRGYGPVVLLLAVCLGIGWLVPGGSPGWAYPGIFFLAFQLVGLAFILATEAIEGGAHGQGWSLGARLAALAAVPLSLLVMLAAIGLTRRSRRR